MSKATKDVRIIATSVYEDSGYENIHTYKIKAPTLKEAWHKLLFDRMPIYMQESYFEDGYREYGESDYAEFEEALNEFFVDPDNYDIQILSWVDLVLEDGTRETIYCGIRDVNVIEDKDFS